MPTRLQRQRIKDWKAPAGARYVGRGRGAYGMFGNPFRYRTSYALARVPATDGVTAWEYESRISADGADHAYHWPNGDVTHHTVRYMTIDEIVATHRRALIAPSRGLRLYDRATRQDITVDLVRAELAGLDPLCWCAPGHPCHGDTLLWVANAPLAEVEEAAAAERALINESAARIAVLHPAKEPACV